MLGPGPRRIRGLGRRSPSGSRAVIADGDCIRISLIPSGASASIARETVVKLLLANPNSTEALTRACAALARGAASPGTEIVPWTNREGPPAVDSVYGDYLAGRPLA